MRPSSLGALAPTLLAAALTAWGGGSAHAQTPETDEQLAGDAQSLIRDGAVDYAAGNYTAALNKFERAYGIYATPEALLNSSRAERRLGRCDKAWNYAQRYLKTVPEAGVAFARDELSHLESDCPEITVTSRPAGASVWIDVDTGVPIGTTPWTGRVPVGRRSIVARLPGSPDVRMALDVVSGTPPALEITFGTPSAPPTTAVRPVPQPPPVVDLTPPASHTPPPEPVTMQAPAPPAKPMPFMHKVGFGTIAAGGASLATAIILGVNVHNLSTGLSATARSGAQAEQVISNSQARAGAANALYVVGILAAAAGVGLVVVY